MSQSVGRQKHYKNPWRSCAGTAAKSWHPGRMQQGSCSRSTAPSRPAVSQWRPSNSSCCRIMSRRLDPNPYQGLDSPEARPGMGYSVVAVSHAAKACLTLGVKGQPGSSTRVSRHLVFHAHFPMLTPCTPSHATLKTLLSKGAAPIWPDGVQSKGA